MDFFILEGDKRYVPPCPLNWNGKLDAKATKDLGKFQLPNHTVFFVEKHMQMIFTDVIFFPTFMVSKLVMNTIQLYLPSTCFKRIIFFSREEKESFDYYIPVLEEVDCLLEGSSFNQDKSVLHHAVVNKEVLFEKKILKLGEMKKTHILINIDLANSILRRGAIGIDLREVECR